MRSVNIAELKDQLSSFLHRVRSGEELVVRDRNLPIARIVPLRGVETDPQEISLLASGQMSLPEQELDHRRFWAIGRGTRRNPKLKSAVARALAAEREDHDGLLGHQRNPPHLRSRPKRKRR